jgi:hypothetical protein
MKIILYRMFLINFSCIWSSFCKLVK